MFHANEKVMGWLGGTGSSIGGLFLLDIPHMLLTTTANILLWALTTQPDTMTALLVTPVWFAAIENRAKVG